MTAPARLVLEDGRVFPGRAVGAAGAGFGEVVFNTAMAGYQETLTDPSYRGQIVVMTASHVGNYGLNHEDVESGRIQVAGFCARHFPERFSNPRGEVSIGEALAAAGVVGIDELDTRALVRHLRSRGAMRGVVSTEDAEDETLVARVKEQPLMAGAALALDAGTAAPYVVPAVGVERARIAAVDYGIKRNILRMLAARGLAVTVVPARTTAEELLTGGGFLQASPARDTPSGRADFAGYFLSNGPGDPEALPECVDVVRSLVASGRPVFGICLGHQLLGRAVGASTFKLKFGHRGVNHPVKSLVSGEVSITSQNHGFAVDPATLPAEAEVTHVNLNDGTCEGFRLRGKPVYAVQYHPESAPGPHDSGALFDDFVTQVMRS